MGGIFFNVQFFLVKRVFACLVQPESVKYMHLQMCFSSWYIYAFSFCFSQIDGARFFLGWFGREVRNKKKESREEHVHFSTSQSTTGFAPTWHQTVIYNNTWGRREQREKNMDDDDNKIGGGGGDDDDDGDV